MQKGDLSGLNILLQVQYTESNNFTIHVLSRARVQQNRKLAVEYFGPQFVWFLNLGSFAAKTVSLNTRDTDPLKRILFHCWVWYIHRCTEKGNTGN